jgi:nucleoside-diphosphate kinase
MSTFIMLKPEAVRRGLVGQIITRFEQKGLVLVDIKREKITLEFAQKHYEEHKGKPFFDRICDHISSGPVIAMVWRGGVDVIDMTRRMIGSTNPSFADVGTIRHDFCVKMEENVIHGSDSNESARRELQLWFGADYY